MWLQHHWYWQPIHNNLKMTTVSTVFCDCIVGRNVGFCDCIMGRNVWFCDCIVGINVGFCDCIVGRNIWFCDCIVGRNIWFCDCIVGRNVWFGRLSVVCLSSGQRCLADVWLILRSGAAKMGCVWLIYGFLGCPKFGLNLNV